jgi:16S rRNA (guanine(527)-N(7))-methyltransferase RsmG
VFLNLLKRFSPLPEDRAKLLEEHYSLLTRWNKTLNLTRVEAPAEAVERHYAESLFLGAQLPEGPLRIADVGSGGGFPGIPVAILCPSCSVTLIESHQRKAVFLREASRKLPNVKVLALRAEEVKERFDWVVSRAVSFEDLRKPLKLAPSAALLTGSEPLGAGWQVIPLPWAPLRAVQVFHVKQLESAT